MRGQALLAVLKSRYPNYTKDELFAHIACGDVTVNGETVRDTSRFVKKDADVVIHGKQQFVSRGGEKLDHALRLWNVQIAGKVMIDAGASTGGFTDCLLQHGARAVHSVDVGRNQLDFRLRTDRRVICHERANIMSMSARDFEPLAEGAVADLSFRSLVRAARHVVDLTTEGWVIALAKPQFEFRGLSSEFDGVIRDPKVVESVLLELIASLQREGLVLRAIAASPIRGRKGNREFLCWLSDDTNGTQRPPFPTREEIIAAIKTAVQENELRPSGLPM